MNCIICGNELSDTAKFCNSCGAKIEREPEIIEPENVETVISQEPAEPAMSTETIIEEPEVVMTALGEEPAVDTRPLRKKPHFLISLLCFLFMIVVFGLEMALGSIITLKFTTSKGAVEKAIESIDITSIELNVDGENKTFAEVILNEVTDEDVKQEDIDKVIEKFEGQEYFSGVIVDLTDFALNGGEAPKLDVDELAGVIEDNKELIEEVTGEKIGDEEIDNFKKSAETFVEEFNENIEEFDEFNSMNFYYATSLGIDLAIWCVVGVIAFFLGILILAYRLNKSGIYRVFNAFAIPTFISGAFYVAIGQVAPKLIKTFIPSDVKGVVVKLLDMIAKFPLYAGITLLVVWLVSLVLSIVLKVVYKNKTRVA